MLVIERIHIITIRSIQKVIITIEILLNGIKLIQCKQEYRIDTMQTTFSYYSFSPTSKKFIQFHTHRNAYPACSDILNQFNHSLCENAKNRNKIFNISTQVNDVNCAKNLSSNRFSAVGLSW